jgi:YgiT-type zinc finger domain-containing protein
MAIRSCPICAGPAEPIRLPVVVRRQGQTVCRLEVPAWRCGECGHVDVEDERQDELIAALENHSLPGDDIVFPMEE